MILFSSASDSPCAFQHKKRKVSTKEAYGNPGDGCCKELGGMQIDGWTSTWISVRVAAVSASHRHSGALLLSPLNAIADHSPRTIEPDLLFFARTIRRILIKGDGRSG